MQRDELALENTLEVSFSPSSVSEFVIRTGGHFLTLGS